EGAAVCAVGARGERSHNRRAPWVFVSPAKADCYGIPAPSSGQHLYEASLQGLPERNLNEAHARDCQTVKALIGVHSAERCRRDGSQPPKARAPAPPTPAPQ